MRPSRQTRPNAWAHGSRRNRQTQGAIERFWRLVIASALNADLDSIALPYAAKVIRELFMNSAEAGSMGMSTVPLSELYCGAAPFLKSTAPSVHLNTNVESAEWDEETSQWIAQHAHRHARLGFPGARAAVRSHGKAASASCRRPSGDALAAPDRAPRALAYLQRASLVRSRDHRPRPRRAARPRDPLDVQQEPPAALAQSEGQLSRTGRSAPRAAFAASTRSKRSPGAQRARRILSRDRKQQSSKRPRWSRKSALLRCSARHRRRAAHVASHRGPTAFSPATGSQPAGPRPWRAPRAPAIWPPKPSAPALSEAAPIPRSRPEAERLMRLIG